MATGDTELAMNSEWGNCDGRYLGKRVVLAVAQMPFDANENTFCTLAPLMEMDGTPIERERDFPPHGEVWWKLTPMTRSHAEPGRLVVAVLEQAPLRGVDRDWYQAVIDSIDSIGEQQFVEIIPIARNQVENARGVIHPSFCHHMDHPPCAIVYVLHNETLYGPLRASSRQIKHDHEVRFEAAKEDRRVCAVPFADVRDDRSEAHVTVSAESRPTRQSGCPVECRYTLLRGKRLESAVKHAQAEVWKTPEDVVRDVSKRLFDARLIHKRDRQTFVSLFREIEEVLLNTPDFTLDPQESDVIELIRKNINSIQKEAQDLADRLVQSGVIDDQISAAIKGRWELYIQENAEQLRAEIDKQVKELQTQKATLENEIASRRRERIEQVDREVAERRSVLDQRAEEIRGLQANLARDQQHVTETLNEVAHQLLQGKEDIIKQFMTLAPLVQSFLTPGNAGDHGTQHGACGTASAVDASANVCLSPFVTKSVSQKRHILTEESFFGRFCDHVRKSGFWHRRIDLVSMHLSCKTNDITILGGQPGTGKSTLPKLYSEALQADENEEGDRYLHVGVSPSWVDAHDLLGYVNAFERIFQPSESGLYMHLVNASEENELRGDQSGMWMVCLDEMNLAQVEHYFGVFMQAIERPVGSRTVPCFAPEMVSRENPLFKWATLRLPSTVRFVGTVNFDETTRQLSQRLLDRATMIRLRPERTSLPTAAGPPRAPSGPPVNAACVREWLSAGETVPPEVGRILDELERPLVGLGCPLNPRRSRAIARYIANAPRELCSPTEALDLQVAQRLLPRVRGLFRASAHEHLDDLKRIVDDEKDFKESRLALTELCEENMLNDTELEM